MKAALAFLATISLALLSVLFYDLCTCYQLGDWAGALTDLAGIAVTAGMMAGVGYAVVREIAWQKVNK